MIVHPNPPYAESKKIGALSWLEDFLGGELHNENTRQAYRFALVRFLEWCESRQLEPLRSSKADIHAYVSTYPGSTATRRQHLSAIKKAMCWLEEQNFIVRNPAASVKLPARQTQAGKRVPTAEQARLLLDRIDISRKVGLRDRALIGLMIFSMIKVSSVLSLRLGNLYEKDGIPYLGFSEKGQMREVPLHQQANLFLGTYIEVLDNTDPERFLFPSTDRSRSGDRLLQVPMTVKGVLKMLKRRIKEAGLPSHFDSQSLRLVGLREYLRGGGDVQTAARLAGYGSVSSLLAHLGEEQTLGEEGIDRIAI